MDYTKQVEEFLERSSDKPKIIVIYGPTGSGKTEMSIDIAKQLDTEIISTDSRQIFKYMDIGTGKITPEETQGVKHHMLDIITPDQSYSVSDFKKKAEKTIIDLFGRGRIPMLVGGTGLYINSIIYDFALHYGLKDDNLKKQLEDDLEEFGAEALHKRLQELDPKYAKEIHPNNSRYVVRALEVKILTGKSKTEYREEKKLKYDVLFLTPYVGDREALYNRINTRVGKMVEAGLVEEVKGLIGMGYDENSFGMRSIGYEEILSYIRGDISLEEAIGMVQQNSRNYAKKQLTWFRKYDVD